METKAAFKKRCVAMQQHLNSIVKNKHAIKDILKAKTVEDVRIAVYPLKISTDMHNRLVYKTRRKDPAFDYTLNGSLVVPVRRLYTEDLPNILGEHIDLVGYLHDEHATTPFELITRAFSWTSNDKTKSQYNFWAMYHNRLVDEYNWRRRISVKEGLRVY